MWPYFYIGNNEIDHTLLCYISLTMMFNKPASGPRTWANAIKLPQIFTAILGSITTVIFITMNLPWNDCKLLQYDSNLLQYFNFRKIGLILLQCFYNIGSWYQWFKDTALNYSGNFDSPFSYVKILHQFIAIQKFFTNILYSIMFYNIFYTTIMLVYCHSTVINKVI